MSDESPTAVYSISKLSADTRWLPVVATWHYQEWSVSRRRADAVDLESAENELVLRQKRMEQHLLETPLPETFVAHIDETPIGSVSLVYYTISGKPSSDSVWLANMYVMPAWRRRGIATSLLEHACNYAREQKLTRLRLYTHDQAGFYLHHGWSLVAQHSLHGKPCDILEYIL